MEYYSGTSLAGYRQRQNKIEPINWYKFAKEILGLTIGFIGIMCFMYTLLAIAEPQTCQAWSVVKGEGLCLTK